jgi:hypothetical protein
VSELFVSRLRESEKLAASAAVSLSTPRQNNSVIRVISNRTIHINEGDTATVNDMLVYAYHPVFISLSSNETVAFIVATGETAGDVWITAVGRV